MANGEQEAVLGYLSVRGIASSQELQNASGKSQASVSRLLAGLSSRVVTLGRARATRYALPRLIRGLAAQQPIVWTDEAGTATKVGVLSFLEHESIHIDSPFMPSGVASKLPWFLQPLRVQGFLGKVNASRMADAGLAADPTTWNLEATLFAALRLHHSPGAVTLGDDLQRADKIDGLVSVQAGTGQGKASPAGLPDALDLLSSDVAKHLPAGSSAGGEQAKFLTLVDGDQHVLVKFTPPRGSPFGQRWHDLLHAECLALDVLAQHGVPVAQSRVVESKTRTYLVSRRFDRVGAHGRRHVVAIGDVHDAFVAGAYSNWHATADALARQGRLQAIQAAQVRALLEFGHLIGNTDMHAGNLALFVTLQDMRRGLFTLAPVYDMLPMRWRPDPLNGDWHDYTPFEPDERRRKGPAAGPAIVFWQRLQQHPAVSDGLRKVAGQMLKRLRA